MPLLQTHPVATAQPKHSLAFATCFLTQPVSAKKDKAVQTPCAFLPARGWLSHSSP